MNEKDFLNAVLQAAGNHPLDQSSEPSQFDKAWTSGQRWEISAQIEIHHHLLRIPGVEELDREVGYPGKTRKEVDLYFKYQNETYAVELKVESPATNQYGGHDLEDAIRMDVEKLKKFNADHRWMVVVAVSWKHQLQLKMAAEWANALFFDQEGKFGAFLCDVDKYPNGFQFAPHFHH